MDLTAAWQSMTFCHFTRSVSVVFSQASQWTAVEIRFTCNDQQPLQKKKTDDTNKKHHVVWRNGWRQSRMVVRWFVWSCYTGVWNIDNGPFPVFSWNCYEAMFSNFILTCIYSHDCFNKGKGWVWQMIIAFADFTLTLSRWNIWSSSMCFGMVLAQNAK